MALAKISCLCVHEALKNSKTAEKPPLKAMPCGTLRALAARENLIGNCRTSAATEVWGSCCWWLQPQRVNLGAWKKTRGGPAAEPPQAGRQDRLQCSKTAAVQENAPREEPGWGVQVLTECPSSTAQRS